MLNKIMTKIYVTKFFHESLESCKLCNKLQKKYFFSMYVTFIQRGSLKKTMFTIGCKQHFCNSEKQTLNGILCQMSECLVNSI